MILYQYTTKNKKFTSRKFYNINQPDAIYRSQEIKDRFGESLSSREKVLEYYLKHKLLLYKGKNKSIIPRINIIAFILDIIGKYEDITNVISFGSGLSAVECLLKINIPNKKVLALDFNPTIVKKNKEFFPELESYNYNFFSDDIEKIINPNILSSSLGVFISSSYVMDDEKFIKVFSSLVKNKVKYVIDFNSGFITTKQLIKEKIKNLLNVINLNIISHDPKLDEITSFQGYSRSKNHLRKLYKSSGYKIVKETQLSTYDYVSILSI